MHILAEIVTKELAGGVAAGGGVTVVAIWAFRVIRDVVAKVPSAKNSGRSNDTKSGTISNDLCREHCERLAVVETDMGHLKEQNRTMVAKLDKVDARSTESASALKCIDGKVGKILQKLCECEDE